MKTRIVLLLVTFLLSACGTNDSEITLTATPETNSRLAFPFITDISRYSEVLNSTDGDLPLITHFPKEIPPEATNVRFAYQPRIMQGAMFLELLMTFPEDQINELWNKYGSFEKYRFSEDKTIDDIPKPILYLISDKNNEIDQNFSIFLISAESAGKEDFIWISRNHVWCRNKQNHF